LPRNLSRVLAVVTSLVVPAAIAASLVLGTLAGGEVRDEVLLAAPIAVPFTALGLVGVLVLVRRRGNPIGAVCACISLLIALGFLAIAYGSWGLASTPRPRGTVLAVWFANWSWYPAIGLTLIGLPLLLPDGRLVGRRWRWVAALGLVSVGVLSVLGALHPQIGPPPHSIPNPIGVAAAGSTVASTIEATCGALVAATVIAALASFVVRYHRAVGSDRDRLKWVVYGFASAIVLNMLLGLTDPFTDTGNVLPAAILTLVPASIGVAVLRHRLFDIDRVISRTVSYALVSVVLAAIYTSGVLGIGNLLTGLTGGAGGDLLIAGSTLAVAAAFRPVRSRVQSLVDRRFDRARYDATRTVQRFASSLRDEVDVTALSGQLCETAATTVQPRTVSVWLAPGSGS
jgi:hypothetical protein